MKSDAEEDQGRNIVLILGFLHQAVLDVGQPPKTGAICRIGLIRDPAATGEQPDRERVPKAVAGLGMSVPPRTGATGMLNQLRPVQGK